MRCTNAAVLDTVSLSYFDSYISQVENQKGPSPVLTIMFKGFECLFLACTPYYLMNQKKIKIEQRYSKKYNHSVRFCCVYVAGACCFHPWDDEVKVTSLFSRPVWSVVFAFSTLAWALRLQLSHRATLTDSVDKPEKPNRLRLMSWETEVCPPRATFCHPLAIRDEPAKHPAS